MQAVRQLYPRLYVKPADGGDGPEHLLYVSDTTVTKKSTPVAQKEMYHKFLSLIVHKVQLEHVVDKQAVLTKIRQ
jgi:hypothetical protein